MQEQTIQSFSDEELKTLLLQAHARNDPKIGRVKNNRKDPNQSDLAINHQGLVGEETVRRYYHLNNQPETPHGLHGDGGSIDLIIRGWTCQVKFNSYPLGTLYVSSPPILNAHFYMLVVPVSRGNLHRVRFAGFTSKHGFILNGIHDDYGHGPVWTVPQNLLSHPADYLLAPTRTEVFQTEIQHAALHALSLTRCTPKVKGTDEALHQEELFKPTP